MGLREVKAKDVMLKDFFCLSPGDTVAGAKLRMARLGIGGAPVVDGRMRLLGIVTHRDMDLSGRGGSNLKVGDLMTREVTSVAEEAPLKEVLKIMREKGYQRIPVIRSGKVVGFVTQSCIIEALYDRL